MKVVLKRVISIAIKVNTSFFMSWEPLESQGLLIVEVSWSHSDTPHSVGLLWTGDQPDAQTSTGQHATLTKYRHPCSTRIRTGNPSKWAAADPRLRPRAQWDRQPHGSAPWNSRTATMPWFRWLYGAGNGFAGEGLNMDQDKCGTWLDSLPKDRLSLAWEPSTFELLVQFRI